MFKQTILIASLALSIGFFACEKQTFDPVLSLGDAASIVAPTEGTAFVIVEGTEEETMTTFTWTAADFGFQAGATYTVEVDLAGNNFASASPLVPAVNATTAPVKNGTVNNYLISRGGAGGVAQQIQVRIKATVGRAADNNVIFSAPVTLTVTPFEAERVYPRLFVPGAYQGWNPGDESTVIYSVPENGIYDGYAFFPDPNSEFKFTDAPNWDNGNFGDNEGDGILDDGGGNIIAPGQGMHRLNVNINDRTYTVTPTNWGVIGSATPTGWDADTDMVYDPENRKLTLTLNLVGGPENAIKFRANDAWDLNLGDNGADLKMEYGGENIAITESGNYTIELFLNVPIYTYTLTRN